MRTLPEFLLTKGFNAHFDPGGNIVFTYEDFTYLLCFDHKDPEFGLLLLPKVWPTDGETPLIDILEALDQINMSFKLVKGYTKGGQVSFCVEIWLQDQADWNLYLPRALQILDVARMHFGAQIAGSAALRLVPPSGATLQ